MIDKDEVEVLQEEESTPRITPVKENQNSSPSEHDPANPFSAKLSPIEDLETKAVREGAETPAFREKSRETNHNRSRNNPNGEKTSGISNGRNMSPMIVVKQSPVVDKNALNKSNASAGLSQKSRSDNGETGEWRQSPFKTVNIATLVEKAKKKNQPGEQIIMPSFTHSDKDRLDSEPNDVNFDDKTLKDSDDPRTMSEEN